MSSKTIKNKQELKKMYEDLSKKEDPVVLGVSPKNITIREFKCACGISVILEGEIARDNSITACSFCRNKTNN